MDPKNIVIARAKAFQGEPCQAYIFAVDPVDGTVRVWDDVAGAYTTCHSLTRRSTQRIQRIARDGRV